MFSLKKSIYKTRRLEDILVCPDCVSGDITIGTQVWAQCNLNVTTYRNGDSIPEVTDPAAWVALTTGAWCYYNNDPSTEAVYGKLYNWYAVNDARGLAPDGYHIPTDAELTTLTDYLGGLTVAGGKMKEAGLCHWNSPNTDATNTSLFTGLPGGYRIIDGNYGAIGVFGYWWSSSEYNTSNAWFHQLYSYGGDAIRSHYNKKIGFSVRLVKDPTPIIPIDCSTQNLTLIGDGGIYKIPILAPADACQVSITLDILGFPDSVAILDYSELTYFAQSGYFGNPNYMPALGLYTFGPTQTQKIYNYNPAGTNGFVQDITAPNKTIEIIANQFPITNTDINKIPHSLDPNNTFQSTRTLVWEKGITSSDVLAMVRVVGNPSETTIAWRITSVTCNTNCTPPTPPTPPCSCVNNEITIGTQIWTCSNANVVTYRDNTPIPQITDNSAWANATVGAWCYYNNDPSTEAVYGKLYNWLAVAGIHDAASLSNPSLRKEFAPAGYHVPSKTEFETLVNSLGGASVASGKMKEFGTTHWIGPNIGATNESCFNALGSGLRAGPNTTQNGVITTYGGWFGYKGIFTSFWSSTEGMFNGGTYGIGTGASIRLSRYSGELEYWDDYKNDGHPVRFIKD